MTAGRSALAIGAAAAVALGGCGSATHKTAATASTRARTVTTTSARARLAALHQQVQHALKQNSSARYGGEPDYLPPAKVPAERVMTARPGHAVLAVEGVAVKVVLPDGSAKATVVGPDVPDEDQGTFQNTAKVSFDVTFADVHGTIPLDASRFEITDENGGIHHPRATLRSGGAAPHDAPAGKSTTLVFHTTLPIGNGRAIYRPVGARAVASWDFDSETD